MTLRARTLVAALVAVVGLSACDGQTGIVGVQPAQAQGDCQVTDDCQMGEEVCSLLRQCEPKCATDMDCEPKICHPMLNYCVECLVDSDCQDTETCSDTGECEG